MSENEEIMGLLLGNVEGSEAGKQSNQVCHMRIARQVRIWCSMTLSLSY